MGFTPVETVACHRLIALALEEDLGTAGDITTNVTIPAKLHGRATLVTRSPGVLAGMQAAEMVFRAVDATIVFDPARRDGEAVGKEKVIARVAGAMRSILAAERTALNFLQHLSGIATLTRRYVEAVAGAVPGKVTQILATRKTIPGWRALAKYAVHCGGGLRHRSGLYDAVLIKDNHLAALEQQPESIAAALAAVRATYPAGSGIFVEIEVDSLEQLDRALMTDAHAVLLDNMSLDDLREAVRRRNELSPGVLLEASGGVTLETVRAIAETGVDCISVGALTHSAPALDIALDYQEP